MASERTKNTFQSNEPNQPTQMQTDSKNQYVERDTNIDLNDSEDSEVPSGDEMRSATEPYWQLQKPLQLRTPILSVSTFSDLHIFICVE
jgi:hypothetical protein